MAKKAIFADIDNTFFDWPAFFAPSFRAMVYALQKKLDLSFEELVSEFKRVYKDKDSLEFSFSIQQLESVKKLDSESRAEMIKTGRGAFRRVSNVRLQPYPGVLPGLKWLRQQDYMVICVTNSPAYLAQKRLYDLGIDQYVDFLVAWEGVLDHDLTSEEFFPAPTLRSRSRVGGVATFSKSDSKPKSVPFELALEHCKVDSNNAWTIGDSIQKDLVPAARLGIKTIWARYGASFDPHSKDAKTLLSITNWDDDEIKLTHAKTEYDPDFIVDEFSEIIQILPEYQPDLFGSG